jgi:prepilin-type N-terminal cleavage/methylation domain-containing protein
MRTASRCSQCRHDRRQARGCGGQPGCRAAGAGFTLVEILVVIAVVSSLLAIAMPALRATREQGLRARARAELAVLAQALESYRRTYGDFPQTGDFPQAPPDTSRPLVSVHAQAKLFNALAGVFGPRAFAERDRIKGSRSIDPGKVTLEFAIDADLGGTTGGNLAPREEALTSVLDPWGRRYLYYYKSAGNPWAWRAGTFLLYSAGSDGMHAAPDPLTGEPRSDSASALVNADNLYAENCAR